MAEFVKKQSVVPGWKKVQRQSHLKNLIAVFLTAVLILAAANVIFKSFRIPKLLSKVVWDGKSPFAVVLLTKPPSVLVYQKETKRAVIFKLPADFYFDTSHSFLPIAKVEGTFSKKDPKEMVRVASLTFRASIPNYIIFRDQPPVSEDWAKETIKSFSSVVSPVSILTRGTDQNIVSTNIGRIDLFRLWWQAKSFSINDLKWVDLTANNEVIAKPNGEKVLGVDSISLNRRISEYLQMTDVRTDGAKVNIINYSGKSAAVSLASDMVSATGASVVAVSSGDLRLEKTQIVSGKIHSRTASYLAKILNCDIKPSPDENDSGQITVMLGSDFSNFYFR